MDLPISDHEEVGYVKALFNALVYIGPKTIDKYKMDAKHIAAGPFPSWHIEIQCWKILVGLCPLFIGVIFSNIQMGLCTSLPIGLPKLTTLKGLSVWGIFNLGRKT